MRTVQSLLVVGSLLLAACGGHNKAEQLSAATASATRLQDSVVEFATSQRHWPSKIEDLKVSGDELPGVAYAISEGGMVSVWFREGSALPGAVLHYTPTQEASGNVTWACKAEGLDATSRPAGCT